MTNTARVEITTYDEDDDLNQSRWQPAFRATQMETQARKLYSGSSEQGLFSLKEQFDNDDGDGDGDGVRWQRFDRIEMQRYVYHNDDDDDDDLDDDDDDVVWW